jgi:hypothetical protein
MLNNLTHIHELLEDGDRINAKLDLYVFVSGSADEGKSRDSLMMLGFKVQLLSITDGF